MEFTKSLVKGKLIKRYKRFFTDVKIGTEIVTAHCPNTGSMKGLLDEGNEVYLTPNNDPKRKLKFGLEIIKSRKNFIGVNTHLANRIVEHGLKNNLIKELSNNDIYSIDGEGMYFYSGGWHLKGVYSLFIGFIFSASTIWNANLIFLQSYGWLIGAIVAWITYYLLAKK